MLVQPIEYYFQIMFTCWVLRNYKRKIRLHANYLLMNESLTVTYGYENLDMYIDID